MITGFRCKETERIFAGQNSPKFGNIAHVAERKLKMLAAATQLGDLAVPPANRLEKLTGDRAGQHSIRINRQWRICFVWKGTDAHDVEIADYH